MIRISDGKLSFGQRDIFTNLNWRIDSTIRIGLVGPNGAGKTTILRILTNEYQLDSGTLEYSKNLRIGYLPQDSSDAPTEAVHVVMMQAFADLNRLEAEMNDLLERSSDPLIDGDTKSTILHRYSEMQETFQKRGGYQRESEAKKVFLGFGFKHDDWDRSVRELSGGWRMRVFLGKLLLEKPDILLLDEPTNHLDTDTLSFFESYLASMNCGLVIVSHDRYFLDRMVNEIAEIEHARFTAYKGNYTKFTEVKEEQKRQLIAAKLQQDKEIAHMQKFVERFGAKNTKATQAQSRMKRIEKIERIVIETDSQSVVIPMPSIPRSGREVLQLHETGHCYGDLRALHPVSKTIYRGDRIAVWGANGAGKSTLLSIMAKTLEPSEGRIDWGHNTHVAYFSQHRSELQDSPNAIIDELSVAAPADMQTRLRDILACFLFRGDDVFKPVSVCSGGEKSRIALAKLLLSPVNVFFLDEPLNHLDMSTVEIFENALKRFEGTIIFVSHDRFFVDRLASQVWEMNQGKTDIYQGTFSDYQYAKQYKLEQAQANVHSNSSASAVDETTNAHSRLNKKEQRRLEAEERKRTNALRKEQEKKSAQFETKIHETEDELADIEAKLASGELANSPSEMARLNKRYKQLSKLKDDLYAKWEKLVDSFDEI